MKEERVIRRFLAGRVFLLFTLFCPFCLYCLCYFCGLCCPCGALPLSVAAASGLPPQFICEIPAKQGDFFNQPEGIAVDKSGNVYVTDGGNGRIQELSPDGVPLVSWGGDEGADGQFDSPQGIAIDGEGNIYVVDAGNADRIQKFSPDRVFLTMWGSKGQGDGQFNAPYGIAVDKSGNVYVADTGNNRIQKFSPDGAFLAKWGSTGSGDGQFREPRGVAADGEGNIYVADSENCRIQKFSPDGVFLAQWGTRGLEYGQFTWPYGVAVDKAGIVYVVDYGNCRIQMFSSGGILLAQWGSNKSPGDGQFSGPRGVAIDRNGIDWIVYVTDAGKKCIRKLIPDIHYPAQWESMELRGERLRSPRDIAVDENGAICVTDRGHYCIQKFSPDGSFLAMWGSQGSGDGQFQNLCGIAVDGNGNVYVADTESSIMSALIPRIQKFSSDGIFLTKWGSYGPEDGQFLAPSGIAVDKSGNVYILDKNRCRVQKFSPDGVYLTQWGLPSMVIRVARDKSEGMGDTALFGVTRGRYEWGDGKFDYPEGIAVDKSGNVYVADTGNHRIQKFSSEGVFLTEWGSEGEGDGQFKRPSGIAVDKNGNVYVADTGHNRIQKFSSDGIFLAKWGEGGSEEGQFRNPSGIAVDKSGNVYVVEADNNRIQKFGYPGTLVIEESRGRTGNEVLVPVTLHYVPAPIFTFGFELTYDANVLEYAGFESGDLVKSFQSFDLRPVEPGKIEVKGNTTESGSGIPKEASGCVVRLKFKVTGGVKDECYPLTVGSMSDDFTGFTPVDGSFCLDHCDGDLNGDGAVTPQDALAAFDCFINPADSCLDCVDINDDGEITPQDALCIFRRYLGMHSCLN